MEVETTLDAWSVQIPGGAGKWENVIAPFMRTVLGAGLPGLEWKTGNITFTPGEALMNVLKTGALPAHEVFMITMVELPGYVVLADAQDYGKNLLVLWKIVFNIHRMSFVRGLAHHQGWIDATKLSPYKQDAFNSLKTITQEAMKEAVRKFGNELFEDYSEEDEKSRGIKNVEVIPQMHEESRGVKEKRIVSPKKETWSIEDVEII